MTKPFNADEAEHLLANILRETYNCGVEAAAEYMDERQRIHASGPYAAAAMLDAVCIRRLKLDR